MSVSNIIKEKIKLLEKNICDIENEIEDLNYSINRINEEKEILEKQLLDNNMLNLSEEDYNNILYNNKVNEKIRDNEVYINDKPKTMMTYNEICNLIKQFEKDKNIKYLKINFLIFER